MHDEIANNEEVTKFLELLPALADLIKKHQNCGDAEINILLTGYNLESDAWAREKAKKVVSLMRNLSSNPDPVTVEATKKALQAQGIPFANMVIAFPELNTDTGVSKADLWVQPQHLSFGDVGLREKKQLKLTVHNGPCRVHCALQCVHLTKDATHNSTEDVLVEVDGSVLGDGMVFDDLTIEKDGQLLNVPITARGTGGLVNKKNVVQPPPLNVPTLTPKRAENLRHGFFILAGLVSVSVLITLYIFFFHPLYIRNTYLRIESSPKGAEVYVDGKLRGISPLVLDELAEGNHNLTLKKNGYKSRSMNISLSSGQNPDIEWLLEKQDTQDVSPVRHVSKPTKSQVKKNMTFEAKMKQAIILYEQQQYDEAEKEFKGLLEIAPDNSLAKYYFEKCKEAGAR